MKHLQAKDLLETLQANPEMYIKVAESKKHDDNAPTMAVTMLEGVVPLEEGGDENVILLWIEPNPETIATNSIIEEHNPQMKEGSGIKVTAMGDELAKTVQLVLDNPQSVKVFPELLAALKKYNGVI